MSCCSGFTVALKSRDRVTGDANAYTLSLPSLPQGSFKATFQIGADMPDITELSVKWAGATRHFQSNQADAYAPVVTFDVYQTSGVLYMDNPANTVDVLFRTVATGQPTTTMPESVITVHFESMQ
jgi:methylaspartate ammonia-lyase